MRFNILLTLRIKILFLFSILLLIFIPIFSVNSTNHLFISWDSISILSWLRLIITLFIVGFLLGFLTLKLIASNDKLSIPTTIGFSYLLSVFVATLLYFISSISSTDYFFGLVVGYTIISSFILLLKRHKEIKKLDLTENKPRFIFPITVKLSRLSGSSLLLIFTFLLWFFGFLSIQITSQFNGSFFLNGVNPLHFNWSLAFTESFPWWLGYSWWFHAYTASLFALSGFPFINAFLALSVFSSVTVIFIYLFGKAYLKNKQMASWATLLASFQGFGWIYFLLNKSAAPEANLFSTLWTSSYKSCDIIAGTILIPNTFSPVFFIAIPAFLAILFIIYSDEFSKYPKYLLIAIMTALLYLSHNGYEVILLSVMLAFFCIFDNRVRKIGFPLSILLGIVLVAIIDIASPSFFYVTSFLRKFEISPYYLYPVLGTLLTCLIITFFRKRNLSLKISKLLFYLFEKMFSRKIVLLSILTVLYLYLIFWLTWMNTPSTFNEDLLYIYAYPTRLGVNMLLPILAFYLLSKEKDNKRKRILSVPLIFSVLLLLIVPIIRLLTDFGVSLSFLPSINESRLTTYFLILISIVNSYVILRLFLNKSYSERKIYHVLKKSLLILMILILGLSSTVTYFYAANIHSVRAPVKITNQELMALDYLRVNGEIDKTILYVSESSRINLVQFTGYSNAMLYLPQKNGNWHQLLSTESPEVTFYLLNEYRVGYIYLTSNDFTILEDRFSNGFLTKLIESLPIFFKNDEVTIFKIPPSSPPKCDSDFKIIAPLEKMDPAPFNPPPSTVISHDSTLLLSSFSKWDYSTTFCNDFFVYSSPMLAVTSDPASDVYGYLDYVKQGGKLVVFNTLGAGFFSNFLSLTSTRSMFVDMLLTSNQTYALNPMEISVASSLDKKVAALAFFATDASEKVPFVFSKQYGDGCIYYIEAQFLPSIISNGSPKLLENIVIIGDALQFSIQEIVPSSNENNIDVYDYYKKGSSWWSYTTSGVTADGIITIQSDGLVFTPDLDCFEVLQFSNTTGNFIFSDSYLLSIKVIGTYTAEFTGSKVTIEESTLAPYISINTEGSSNLTLLPQTDGEIEIVIQKNGLTEQTIARDLYLKCAPANDIFFKSPNITFNGIMSLNKTWIYPGNLILTYGDSLTLMGSGSIRFVLADQNSTYLILNNLEGSVTKRLDEVSNISGAPTSELVVLLKTITSNIGIFVTILFVVLFVLVCLNVRVVIKKIGVK